MKTSEPFHLGLYYHIAFKVSFHLMWYKPPHQEGMVAREDLMKTIFFSPHHSLKINRILTGTLVGHSTNRNSYLK